VITQKLTELSASDASIRALGDIVLVQVISVDRVITKIQEVKNRWDLFWMNHGRKYCCTLLSLEYSPVEPFGLLAHDIQVQRPTAAVQFGVSHFEVRCVFMKVPLQIPLKMSLAMAQFTLAQPMPRQTSVRLVVVVV
jgi:hypothetical protein